MALLFYTFVVVFKPQISTKVISMYSSRYQLCDCVNFTSLCTNFRSKRSNENYCFKSFVNNDKQTLVLVVYGSLNTPQCWARAYCVCTLIVTPVHVLIRSLRRRALPLYAVSLTEILLLSGNVHPNPGPIYPPLPVLHEKSAASILSKPAAHHNLCAAQPVNRPDSIVSVCLHTTPADDHCFIYALSYSLSSYIGLQRTYNDLLNEIKREFSYNEATYANFHTGSTASLRSLASEYFNLKHYNTDFGDLVPQIAASSLQLRTNICGRTAQRITDCHTICPVNQPHDGLPIGTPYVVLHLANIY